MLTKVRGRERSDLDAEQGGEERSDAPIDVAMEMVTAATSIAAETAATTILEPIGGNYNGKRTGRSQAPAAPSDWRSRMERTIRQQAQELMHLHLTVGHLANLWEVRAPCEEEQWQGIIMWMQEWEQRWVAIHEDDKLWGAGIKNMIAMVMSGVAACQEGSGKETEMTARTDGGGLEASLHAATTRDKGQEKRQHLQQQPKPKPQLKLQPNPQPTPKPKSAHTPARQWETVPPRAKSQRAPIGPGRGPGPGPALTAGSSMAERCLISWRDKSVLFSNKMHHEIASAINVALFHEMAAAHVWIINAERYANSVIAVITHPNATAAMALKYHDISVTAVRTVNKCVGDIEENESWETLKIPAVPLTL